MTDVWWFDFDLVSLVGWREVIGSWASLKRWNMAGSFTNQKNRWHLKRSEGHIYSISLSTPTCFSSIFMGVMGLICRVPPPPVMKPPTCLRELHPYSTTGIPAGERAFLAGHLFNGLWKKKSKARWFTGLIFNFHILSMVMVQDRSYTKVNIRVDI